MVFGPVLDYRAARQRGVSTVQVLSEGNARVSTKLPTHVKVIFWLTNVPYWFLAVELGCGAAPHVGSRSTHALAASMVAVASTAFHGSVLFGPVASPWPRRLLSADILAANSYGVALACCCGLFVALRRFILPLALLAGAASAKRAGHVQSYAWLHGTWHVWSCLAMWQCLYSVS